MDSPAGPAHPAYSPAPPPNMTKALISTRRSSTAAHLRATVESLRSMPADSYGTLRAVAHRFTHGTSCRRTQFSESFTPRVATPHGPTNIRHTPLSAVPATAPTWMITT